MWSVWAVRSRHRPNPPVPSRSGARVIFGTQAGAITGTVGIVTTTGEGRDPTRTLTSAGRMGIRGAPAVQGDRVVLADPGGRADPAETVWC